MYVKVERHVQYVNHEYTFILISTKIPTKVLQGVRSVLHVYIKNIQYLCCTCTYVDHNTYFTHTLVSCSPTIPAGEL